ncbi:unnamed protein product [Linum tenue]|uniref:Uncharacterized protein n=1 Tax=Linum tenue TaxID=586396 RepID=A0AAV0JNY9_9ROSI|nr:unnamed protein product [Linum tenue]
MVNFMKPEANLTEPLIASVRVMMHTTHLLNHSLYISQKYTSCIVYPFFSFI